MQNNVNHENEVGLVSSVLRKLTLINPRLTKLFFFFFFWVTRLTRGLLQPPPWIFANESPVNLALVSIDRY